MTSTSQAPGMPAREQGSLYGIDEDNVYKMTPYERIELFRRGVPVQRFNALCARLHLSREALMAALGLSRATISRKAKAGQSLSPDESERVIGVEYLFRQAESMADSSPGGEPFDAGAWLGMWLTSPLPALANVRPIDYFDTIEGLKFVSTYLSMIESGAYA